MTTPQWENLPQPITPPTPGGAAWAGFAADPRLPESAGLRASNSDRDLARSVLTRARNSGRLDAAEFAERMELTRQSTFLGELAPLLADVAVDPAARTSPRASGFPGRVLGWFPGWWLRLALLFNVIWLITAIASAGDGSLYYWPIPHSCGASSAPVATRSRSCPTRRSSCPRARPTCAELPRWGRLDSLAGFVRTDP